MSHKTGGYFYFRYTYQCPYTDADGQNLTDNNYHTAIYTAVKKQDHAAQTAWYNDIAMPAVEADIRKNFYGATDRNNLGMTYERYNQQYVRRLDFAWYDTLPVHTSGPNKGHPFGKPV
ncbi:hypothetical protein ACLOAV_003139 [Pseudogymnoascus australis]